MSKNLRTRPSDLYAIGDEVAAYFFDRAIATFGMAVEADLDAATRSAKNEKAAKRKAELVLMKWLDMRGSAEVPAASSKTSMANGFRDPAVMLSKSGPEDLTKPDAPVEPATDVEFEFEVGG